MHTHIRIGLLAICLVVAHTLRAEKTAAELEAYYTTTIGTSINNLSGTDLFNAVHTAAKNGYKSLSYSDLWTAYQTTDTRADGSIWDMYGGCSFTYSTNQCGNYSSECDCYNREHSIPKSWFGGSESANTPGTDLFHVVPTDGKVNGKRSNYAFGEVSSATYTYGNSRLGSAASVTIAATLLSADDYTATCTKSPSSSRQMSTRAISREDIWVRCCVGQATTMPSPRATERLSSAATTPPRDDMDSPTTAWHCS